MADSKQIRSVNKTPAHHETLSTIEIVAIALSVLWLLASALFFLVMGTGPIGGGAFGFVMTVLAIFLPVAMIWVAAMSARTTRVMREESRRLQAAIDAIRKTYVSQSKLQDALGGEQSVSRKLDEIAAAPEVLVAPELHHLVHIVFQTWQSEQFENVSVWREYQSAGLSYGQG